MFHLAPAQEASQPPCYRYSKVGTRDLILPYLTQVPPSICTSAVCTCAYVCVMQGQGHHPYHCATATSDSPPHHTDSPRGVECSRYSREEKIQGQARVLLVFFTCSMGRVIFYLLNEEGCIVPCEGKKYLRLHFPDSAIFYRLKVRVGKVA